MVSVVIPVHNRRILVRQAIASVLSQTYRNFELIIADDASDDGIEEDALWWKSDNRIRYLRIERSGFPGAVRNFGVSEARGEWVAFLDSDDLWYPRKLDIQMNCLAREPGLRCIHARETWLRGERVVSQASQRHKRTGDIFADALRKCIIGPSTVVLERRLFNELGGFRDDLEIAEDYELWLRLTARFPVAYVDEPLVVKRSGHGMSQLSETYGHIEGFRITALEHLLQSSWLEDDPVRRAAAERELVRKCAIFASGARKRGNIAEAERCEAAAAAFSRDRHS